MLCGANVTLVRFPDCTPTAANENLHFTTEYALRMMQDVQDRRWRQLWAELYEGMTLDQLTAWKHDWEQTNQFIAELLEDALGTED